MLESHLFEISQVKTRCLCLYDTFWYEKPVVYYIVEIFYNYIFLIRLALFLKQYLSNFENESKLKYYKMQDSVKLLSKVYHYSIPNV